jgi:starch phosphorylase
VSQLYRDPAAWARTAILNVSRMGKFSSDRTVRQYAEEIWGIRPVPIRLSNGNGAGHTGPA